MDAAHRADHERRRHEEVETVVVGAGQAGLAASHHLARRGLPHVVLDANDRVGDAWRHRWDSLRLFTPARYSSLPGMAFPAPPATYPTKDQVADYMQAYAREFRLPIRTGVEVQRLSRDGDRFEVDAGDRVWLAEHVIVATGHSHAPRIPPFAAELDRDIVQLHSRAYRNPSQLQAGDVLVVGAANSGAEIAVEVAPHHRTWLSGRDPGQEPTRAGTLADRLAVPLIWLLATRVLTVRTPMGRKVRDQFTDPPRGIPLGRVRRSDITAAGIERVPRTVGVADGRPVLEDGRALDVANVVWCTGFTPGLDWIDLPVHDHRGVPVHDRGIVDAAPGLYFVGLMFQYSLSSSLVGGVGRDAAHVVDHLASTRTTSPGGSALPTGTRSSGSGVVEAVRQ